MSFPLVEVDSSLPSPSVPGTPLQKLMLGVGGVMLKPHSYTSRKVLRSGLFCANLDSATCQQMILVDADFYHVPLPTAVPSPGNNVGQRAALRRQEATVPLPEE